MKKSQNNHNTNRSLWTNVISMFLAAALLFVGYMIYTDIQARSSADQQRTLRQQQEAQEQASESTAATEEEENRQQVEYLKCQVEAEKTFIAGRDQIPTGYSTSQHILMLQTLEQKRSTDLDNCDRLRQ